MQPLAVFVDEIRTVVSRLWAGPPMLLAPRVLQSPAGRVCYRGVWASLQPFFGVQAHGVEGGGVVGRKHSLGSVVGAAGVVLNLQAIRSAAH